MYVFVYGTLKTGEPNHHWLTETVNGRGIFKWKGKTVEKYPLVIGSQYNVPFLLDLAGTGHNIKGEIYEIDEQKLAYLDILENYPILYTRRLENIIIENAETGETVKQAWVYFLTACKSELLEKPFLDDYSAYGPHGLLYVSTVDRLEDPLDI